MPFDLKTVLDERKGQNFTLHSKYINPQLPRVLGQIEFDRFYVKGEGCYLVDDKGGRYLDLLSGFGVFALGRSHPTIVRALHDALDADLPNLVQMDCSLLPGVLAEELVARSHPGIERVFFTNSGAEAVESAIKFAACRDEAHPHPLLRPRLSRPDDRRPRPQRRDGSSAAASARCCPAAT